MGNNRMLSKKSSLSLAILATLSTTTFAETDTSNTTMSMLPSIQVNSDATTQNQKAYAATTASALKTQLPLFETAQSISVITQQQIQEKQIQSVSEALQGVAGVNASPYGRRGWDDFIIRGQISSAQTYIDGLRAQTSTNVLRAEDIAGIQSIEVVKGPTSVGYGLSLPGGLVNLTTKRPEAETFYRANATYGSYADREGVIDVNYSPNQTKAGAVRLVAKYSDQHDPTDYVYFKNTYLAASYNIDLGAKDEWSVIASYQNRDYIRNQGIPQNYSKYGRNIFIGEPDRSYDVNVYRFGSNYTHYFDNGWKYNQNLAIIKSSSWSDSVFAASGASFPNVARQVNFQDKRDVNYSLDNNIQRTFKFSAVEYDAMIGVDLMKERSSYYQRVDNVNALNANTLVYGVTTARRGTPSWNLTYNQYTGLYLKNNFKISDKWILNLSGRHDWTQVEVNNLANGNVTKNSDNAFTGNASLMYKLNDYFAPYITYATSFMPVTDTGAQGQLLDPEEGKQTEIGMKFQGLDQRLQGYVSYYDLVRKNVTETETVGTRSYSIQTGEQTTKGYEAELSAALTPQWNVSTAYSYIPTAKITASTTLSDLGKRINHVPKTITSLSTQYYFAENKQGWNIGGGVRYQGASLAQRGTYYTPIASYTLFDVNAGYEAKHWGASLSVKNIFDKDYIQGTTPNAQLITFGNPRTFSFNLKFKY